jgi:hypothetical protein
MNPLQQWNMAGNPLAGNMSSGSSSQLPEGWEVLYDASGQPKKVEKIKNAKNGNIVKAIKNL